MEQIKEFEVGKTYQMRSACDYDCVWTYKVVARNIKTIYIQQIKSNGEKCKVQYFRVIKSLTVYRKAESIRPLGKFSMAPVLSADNEVK